MPRRRRASPSTIEQDFNTAIDRLQKGTPSDHKLRQLAQRGSLRINFTTVAREARRSRTLIAHERCAYPAVRMRILSLKTGASNPKSLSSVVFSLRARVKALETMLQAQGHQMLDHSLARQSAERDCNRWKSAYHNLAKSRGGKILSVVDD